MEILLGVQEVSLVTTEEHVGCGENWLWRTGMSVLFDAGGPSVVLAAA